MATGRPRDPRSDAHQRRVRCGVYLRHLRTKHGFTITALARAGNLDKAHLSTIENYHSLPSIATIHRIADAMGLSEDERINLLWSAQYAPWLPTIDDLLQSENGEFR